LSAGLGRDFDEFTGGRRWRDWLAVLLESFEVEFDGLMNRDQNFVPRFANGDAPGKIRNIGPE